MSHRRLKGCSVLFLPLIKCIVLIRQTVQPDSSGCCAGCFPYGFRREAVELLKLTWPLV